MATQQESKFYADHMSSADPNTPPYEDNALGKAKLGKFEPKLITDVLSTSGIDPLRVRNKHISRGVNRVVDIK